jgi:hypothetical protein
MKRYLVFCGDNYYPCGGWHDFQKGFDTVGEAKDYLLFLSNYDWFQIVDAETMNVVSTKGPRDRKED